MATVTCHTEDCPNAGIPIDATTTWVDEDGVTHPVDFVVCGPCGQPIDDITETEATPEEREQT